MADLQERLARIAEETSGARPPADLWRRGVRRRRRRTAGVLAASVVAAVVVGTGGSALVRTVDQADVGPTAARVAPAIPDRLRSPSPWTPGTNDEGPLGKLAALLPGEQHDHVVRLDATYDPVGVSATTGEYRFLDLPRMAAFGGDATSALSTDGSAVAYWSTGHLAAPDGRGDHGIDSVSIYDTVTGEVVRHRFRGPLGLSPELLAWSSPDRLVIRYGRITERRGDGRSSTIAPVLTWDRHEPSPQRLADGGLFQVYDPTAVPGGGLAASLSRGRGIEVVTWDAALRRTGRHPVRGPVLAQGMNGAAVSGSGRRAVLAADTAAGDGASRFLVGRVPRALTASSRSVARRHRRVCGPTRCSAGGTRAGSGSSGRGAASGGSSTSTWTPDRRRGPATSAPTATRCWPVAC